MKILLKDIAVIHRQRKAMDPNKLQELAQSIKARGRLIHPVVVRPPREDERGNDGERVLQPWVLMVGGRRYAAHALLGWPEIEANAFDTLDELEQEIIELEENLRRENISSDDEVAAHARIHELRERQAWAKGEKHTAEKTAEELGISPAQLSKDLRLHREQQKDPSLKGLGTKAKALRALDHKQTIKSRIAAVKQVDVQDLREKLQIADARSYARTIPSASIDLVFTDLPFGQDHFKVRADGERAKGAYDDSPEVVKDFLADIVPQIVRVVKPEGWIVLFMNWEHYGFLSEHIRDACAVHGEYRAERHHDYCNARWKAGVDEFYESPRTPRTTGEGICRFLSPELPPWYWIRPNSQNYGHWPELHAYNCVELLCVVNGGSARLTKKPVSNALIYESVYGKERLHEHQKPHELCKEIISRTTVAGERVLDLCFGSGAHLAAAADLGRDFLGCELNPDNLSSALLNVAQYYKSAYVRAAIEAGKAGPERTRNELAEGLAGLGLTLPQGDG